MNIFECKETMPDMVKEQNAERLPVEPVQNPLVIRTVMTPSEDYGLIFKLASPKPADYPRNNSMDVDNIQPRRRGHNY